MNQPNPWILLMGGGALVNLALLVGGLHAPAWVRYPLMALCVLLGIASVALALVRQFQKKPERRRVAPKRAAKIELLPETAARMQAEKAASPERPRRASTPPSPPPR